jgi:hypothetical protein
MRASIAVLVGLFVLSACRHASFGYADAEDVCAIGSACFGGGFDGQCVRDTLGSPPTFPELGCVLAAGRRGDCDAVHSCVGLTTQTDPSCTSTNTFPSMCQGTAVVSCSNFTGVVPHLERGDCSLNGETCVNVGTGTTGNAECVHGSCSWTGSQCNGAGEVQWCHSGFIDEVDECASGTTCREFLESGQMQAECVSDTPCTTDTCDGNRVRFCRTIFTTPQQQFFADSEDCAAGGGHCVLTMSGAQCQPDGSQCDPSMFTTTCDGSSIRYCGPDGQIHVYDCRARSFAGCRTSSSGSHLPYCVPTGADLFHT